MMTEANDEREFDADSGFDWTVESKDGAGDAATAVSNGDSDETDGSDDSNEVTPDEAETAAGEANEATANETAADRDTSTAQMRAAISEVRREGRKIAFLYALLDAGLVALAVNIGLRLFRPDALGGALSLPGAVAGAGGVVPATIYGSTIAGLGIGILTFVAEFSFRTRRPLVEQFETANPAVREELRTARDSIEDGTDTEMARHLYEDVLGDLRETSSLELVGTRRVVVTSLLVVVVSLASIHVAVVGLDLSQTFDDGDQAGSLQPNPDEPDREDEDLEDGEQILGDAENISAGDESINASVQGTGSGEGTSGSTAPPSSYDDSGFADAAVESQQAGYAESENVEDAELIREYNLKIRDEDDEDDT
ncbi:hypothetical protein C499_18554 [Halogeometricum borinquense DSM 11551]|uniref:Uncharacterized protein n=2 Tax=Halogeometricum borinquense TaxID=60847 RepID=E4NNS6_HALBP|nr:hypothetical protein Hbor_19740 [Halogeometricum borinquense DSM 11551]ELY23780.1 hypothetical protein C499_18554 [Halogeometricum borinquense DSM 11551]